MKLSKLVLGALTVALAASLLAGCGSSDQQKAQEKSKAPLKVATNATFVPFEFKSEESGDYAGYEMDLVRAVGKQLGREIQIQDMTFNGLIPLLQSKDVDIA